jgi:hypothetical protein
VTEDEQIQVWMAECAGLIDHLREAGLPIGDYRIDFVLSDRARLTSVAEIETLGCTRAALDTHARLKRCPLCGHLASGPCHRTSIDPS